MVIRVTQYYFSRGGHRYKVPYPYKYRQFTLCQITYTIMLYHGVNRDSSI